MGVFERVAILVSIAALFGYVNHRWLRLPTAIGLMLIAFCASVLLLCAKPFWPGLEREASLFLSGIDFEETLLRGMLGLLLFAGALHVNLEDLYRQKWIVSILASAGVVFSTFLNGFLAHWVFRLLGLEIPLVHCFLFGALISPTDPIAVLAVLKTAGVPRDLETVIAGESLFNDGVAVVVFLVILETAVGGGGASPAAAAKLFFVEAAGGAALGLAAGALAYRMLKSVDSYRVEILITLALATGGYALAGALHISGPIAVVVAGLLIGNRGRMLAMSDKVRERLDDFWELVDEILNAVLFVLIGLELLMVSVTGKHVAAGLLAIPVVLAVRLAGVAAPVAVLKRFRSFDPGVVKILTWAGLRGGISVALALSIPEGPWREPLIAVTYCVVVFSILVQGLTAGKVARAASGGETERAEKPEERKPA